MLQEYFASVELHDGSGQLKPLWTDNHPSHTMDILSFKWIDGRYDCVVAVWTLSQLKLLQVQAMVHKIDGGLKDCGYVVLIEPVLDDDEKGRERPAKVEDEGHVVRADATYQRFFKGARFDVIHHEKAKMKDLCEKWQMLYLLKKGI